MLNSSRVVPDYTNSSGRGKMANQNKGSKNGSSRNIAEACAYAAGGAGAGLAAGAIAAEVVGGIGLLAPAAGIAVGIGAAPVVAAGVGVGFLTSLAAFGIKQALR